MVREGWIDLWHHGQKYNGADGAMPFNTFGHPITFYVGEIKEDDLKGGWDVMTPTKEVDLGPAGLQY